MAIAIAAGTLSACKRGSQPFRASESATTTIPELPNVQVVVGNVHLAHVDLRIVTRNGEQLAELKNATTGASLPFVFRGRRYALDVLRVEDHTLHDDWVHLRCYALD